MKRIKQNILQELFSKWILTIGKRILENSDNIKTLKENKFFMDNIEQNNQDSFD